MSAEGAKSPDEIRIGISACLLGERVRFDGGHKRDGFLTGTLGEFVTFVPVCPEVAIGLGTPREAIRLVRSDRGTRLVGVKSGEDHTEPMRRYSQKRTRELANADLDGFIVKRDSPTCGLERVRVYDQNGSPTKSGRGLFTEALIDASPLLPVEEEGRLCDPKLRESFFERVFAYRRVRSLFRARWSIGDLVRFHTREKMFLLAHHEPSYRELGRIVAGAKQTPRAELRTRYEELFMQALGRKATARKNTNVLQHMLGHLKDLVDGDDRRELVECIEEYRRGMIPLVVPVTLLRHHVRRHSIDYLSGQTYLEPHPKELMLRNHV
ncbi:MAG: DUF1722 domain-containing protein [Planctomycetes bacterium]|nr:DUF1722 domain-containing protein [Planctomycetota bacterium]